MKRQSLLTKGVHFTFVLAMTAGLFCVTFALIAVTGTGGSSDSVAHAAGTINVTTLADEYDTTPNGTCSLREAIQSINTDSSFGGCTNPGNAADTIQLSAGTHHLTLKGTGETYDNQNGSLYFNKTDGTLIILGAGSNQTVINAQSFNDRVFKFYDSSFDNTMSVAIEGVTIQGGNCNCSGGGIYVEITSETASFSLRDVVIQNNQVSGSYSGGGLYLGSGTGHTTLERVTIYNNQGYYGGGIYYIDQYGVGQDGLVLTNVTIYSNTAGFTGGGLYAYGSGGGITATNVTIAKNKAVTYPQGNIYNYGTIIRLKNTIIADGINLDCGGNPSSNITSLGYNLASDNSCNLTGTLDMNSTDPLLDSQLRYNGGTMPTLALLDNSPAIDKGSGCPDTDQRGFPRLGPCDIGAFEYAEWDLSLPLVLKNE